MKKAFLRNSVLGAIAFLSLPTLVYAVNVLQLGAYAADGAYTSNGTYVDYKDMYGEEDTAFITGGTLLAAGAFGTNTQSLGSDTNWGLVDSDLAIFNGRHAILMATVEEGYDLSALLQISGATFITKLDTFDYKNNHYPVGAPGMDYLFFDIGSFSSTGTVPNFDDESGSASGEIKTLGLTISGFDWVHFDLMALEVTVNGHNVKTTWEVNPNSHDVAYRDPGTPVPEPATMLLFGTGIAGLAGIARRKRD